MTLEIINLTPRVGSEIRTDVATLLGGSEAANIRKILEERGVVFFRGLDIGDEQQVAIARTLGNIVASEGEDGIYKISLDKGVNSSALPEPGRTVAGDQAVGNRRADRILQHLCGLR